MTLQVKLLSGILATIVLFQNCTPNTLVINEDLKSKTLSSKSLMMNSLASEEAKIANFTFVCPRDDSNTPKDLLHSGELKAVVEKFDFDSGSTTVLCEVHGVKKQILNSRSIDLSTCEEIPGPQNAHLDLYIVPEEIGSSFSQHKINIDTTPLALGGGYTLNYLAMSSKAQDSACDDAGAPLMIQLSNHATVLSLTAPTDGIEMDLLGGKSYQSSHDKVLASWFTPNSAGDVFVLVKPNKDHLVLGANEMFADTTLGPDTKYAKQGFAALAKFDDNKDLMISTDDVVFSELRLWKDSNHDGQVQESELSNLGDQKVRAIDLRYATQYGEVDVYGNQSRNKSVVVMEDETYGVAFDLWLRFIHKLPTSEAKASVIRTPSAEADASATSDAPESQALDPSPADTNSQTSEPHAEEPLPDSTPLSAELSE